ncbi:uncharacterized protein LY89DRAFT_735029 [Mollisia scopiformis]|uniref:Uncharacterized protein n=1 Tax=Mollisia scopiformis TaxID=149040 RepID=A0A194X6T5_MOLSC|nr:uncharacterized protein LY89DRAFT_735029 [Mollisia scopiformis]KUJ15883.1 hypothetical protein LY89DRAFT_735029 [Mollisia scopiformis]
MPLYLASNRFYQIPMQAGHSRDYFDSLPLSPPAAYSYEFNMAAISKIEAQQAVANLLAKREKSWAAREPGVILVFCIVFIVASGLLGLCVSKALAKRRAARQTN